MVFQTGLPARLDDHEGLAGPVAAAARASGVRSGVAVPITVDGRVWGMIAVGLRPPRATLPAHAGMLSSRLVVSAASPQEIEQRLAAFTELVATAISKAQVHDDLRSLADEQAALRRVATLVAEGVPSEALFSAVCDEVQALAGTDACVVVRFEADGTVSVMGTNADRHPVGARLELDPDYVVGEVHRTGRAARFDTSDPTAPGMPEVVRTERIRCGLASPIVVEGELWGAITTASRERPLAADMERRLADFTELMATAISNAQARAELAASRARIAAAAADERRRVVRDLHDGAQQRLVHTVVTLKLAQQALATGADDGPLLVQEALGNAEQATAEVRDLAHGILPSVLAHGGLRAGIDALGSRTPIPVEIDVSVDRLAAPVEATAYFVVAEALTNVAKHSSAGHAEVVARIEDGMLRVEMRDDGVGGASPDGTGWWGSPTAWPCSTAGSRSTARRAAARA
jgi:signal transduction histidine kinase